MSMNVVTGSGYYEYGNTERTIQSTSSQENRNHVEETKSNPNPEEALAYIGGNGGKVSVTKPSDINRLNSALEYVNGKLKLTQTKCEIEYHDDIRRVSVKILDKNTDEVIREIPPEETIKLIKKLWEFAGFIVDERR